MGKLPFPREVPPGDLRELFLVLHDLHWRAGAPPTREMGEAVGCSHHKVHQMFTQPRLPADGDTLFAVAEWLARQGRRPRIKTGDDEEEFRDWFDEKLFAAQRWVNLAPPELDTTANVHGDSGGQAREPVPPHRAATTTGRRPGQEASARSQNGRVITADFTRSQDRQVPRSSLLPDLQASQAVLIGSGSFADPSLRDLPSAPAGSEALGALLAPPDREGSFLPASTQTVINPTRIELLDSIERAADAAEDVLLVYFAGHGLITRGGELMLAGRDTRIAAEHTSASWDSVRRLLSASPARRSVVLLDACYSGRAIDAMGPLSGLADTPAGTHMISSTSAVNASIAPAGEQFPAFTGALISLLKTGDLTPPGSHQTEPAPEYLTIDVIYDQIYRYMRDKGYPEPHRRSTGSNDIALAVNPAHRRLALEATRQ